MATVGGGPFDRSLVVKARGNEATGDGRSGITGTLVKERTKNMVGLQTALIGASVTGLEMLFLLFGQLEWDLLRRESHFFDFLVLLVKFHGASLKSGMPGWFSILIVLLSRKIF